MWTTNTLVSLRLQSDLDHELAVHNRDQVHSHREAEDISQHDAGERSVTALHHMQQQSRLEGIAIAANAGTQDIAAHEIIANYQRREAKYKAVVVFVIGLCVFAVLATRALC